MIRTIVWSVIGTLVALGLGGVAFAYSGIENVAADHPHAPPIAWFLHTTMKNSVASRAPNVPNPPDLKDTALINEGAQDYKKMCAGCHMAPGAKPSPVRIGLNPTPPQLSKSAGHLPPKAIFWVVKHGVRMTAMPAWGKTQNDHTIWALTAFLKHELPNMTAQQYADVSASSGK